MITEAILFLNSYNMIINLVCHLLTFIGTFYIALHSRKTPQWIITPMWYLGLVSLIICATIITQYISGPTHPLSYLNLGTIIEYLSNIIMTFIILSLFMVTVKDDVSYSKHRRKKDDFRI